MDIWEQVSKRQGEREPEKSRLLGDKYENSAFEQEYKKAHGFSTMSETIDAIADEFKKNVNITHSLQDIFGGVHMQRYRADLYGHSKEYWEKRGSNGVTSEAFAHMFEASFSPEKRKLMEKYLPTAWAEFMKIRGGLI